MKIYWVLLAAATSACEATGGRGGRPRFVTDIASVTSPAVLGWVVAIDEPECAISAQAVVAPYAGLRRVTQHGATTPSEGNVDADRLLRPGGETASPPRAVRGISFSVEGEYVSREELERQAALSAFSGTPNYRGTTPTFQAELRLRGRVVELRGATANCGSRGAGL